MATRPAACPPGDDCDTEVLKGAQPPRIWRGLARSDRSTSHVIAFVQGKFVCGCLLICDFMFCEASAIP
jgi:hypothetical protein